MWAHSTERGCVCQNRWNGCRRNAYAVLRIAPPEVVHTTFNPDWRAIRCRSAGLWPWFMLGSNITGQPLLKWGCCMQMSLKRLELCCAVHTLFPFYHSYPFLGNLSWNKFQCNVKCLLLLFLRCGHRPTVCACSNKGLLETAPMFETTLIEILSWFRVRI